MHLSVDLPNVVCREALPRRKSSRSRSHAKGSKTVHEHSLFPAVFSTACLAVFLAVLPAVFLTAFLAVFLAVLLAILTVCLAVCLEVCLTVSLTVCLAFFLTVFLTVFLTALDRLLFSSWLSLLFLFGVLFFAHLTHALSSSLCCSGCLFQRLTDCLFVILS